MDEIVISAMARWPDVPSVYRWLSLDRRGQFAIKGERIANPAIHAFIGRNYARDEAGRWFFQNGPQRVFVRLDYTPFVLRTDGAAAQGLATHFGDALRAPHAAFLDEAGSLLIAFEGGVGLIHDLDLAEAASWIRDGAGRTLDDDRLERVLVDSVPVRDLALVIGGSRLALARIRAVDVPRRFAFDPDPQPARGEPEC